MIVRGEGGIGARSPMAKKEDANQKGWNFEAAAMPFVDSLYNTAYRMTRNAEDAEDPRCDNSLRPSLEVGLPRKRRLCLEVARCSPVLLPAVPR